jgi:phosphoserine phosphatase RsbX
MAEVMTSRLEWGTAAATMPGETESGDRYWARAVASGMVFAVIDGLGHGGAAAAAAGVAIATLERHVGAPLVDLLRRCHESLRGTRGVAMSLALFDTADATLTWIGVGNVEGTLLRRDAGLPAERLLLRNGVVGIHLPMLRAAELAVRSGDVLTMVTDGVAAGSQPSLSMDGRIESMADRILADACKGTDDALVLVARYRGPRS